MNYHYLPLVLLLPFLGGSYYFGYTPALVSLVLAALSLLCFALYYRDKRAASRGGWRTPEKTLHLVALLGGWPGAILGQQLLRHKTQKRSFRLVFWLTVLANVSALLWMHTGAGSALLHTWVAEMDSLGNRSGLYGAAPYRRGLNQFHLP